MRYMHICVLRTLILQRPDSVMMFEGTAHQGPEAIAAKLKVGNGFTHVNTHLVLA